MFDDFLLLFTNVIMYILTFVNELYPDPVEIVTPVVKADLAWRATIDHFWSIIRKHSDRSPFVSSLTCADCATQRPLLFNDIAQNR
jgi:hypothetical protein